MKKRLFHGFLAVCLLFGLVACGGSKAWQTQYDLGMRYLSEGSYEEAILAFEAAIEIDPMQENAYIRVAELHILLERPELAVEVLTRAITTVGLTPTLTATWTELLGDAYPLPDPNSTGSADLSADVSADTSDEVYPVDLLGKTIGDIEDLHGTTMSIEENVLDGYYYVVFPGVPGSYTIDNNQSADKFTRDAIVTRMECYDNVPIAEGLTTEMTYAEIAQAMEGKSVIGVPLDYQSPHHGNPTYYVLGFHYNGIWYEYEWSSDSYEGPTDSVRTTPITNHYIGKTVGELMDRYGDSIYSDYLMGGFFLFFSNFNSSIDSLYFIESESVTSDAEIISGIIYDYRTLEDGLTSKMTYPELVQALQGKVVLDEPQFCDDDDVEFGYLSYGLTFEYNGYRYDFYWWEDPYTTYSTAVWMKPTATVSFNNTYWHLGFGQTLGTSFDARFLPDGTFLAVSYAGWTTTGTYTYADNVLTIDFESADNIFTFIQEDDGFRSSKKYEMQVGEDFYYIRPSDGAVFLEHYESAQ